MTLQGMLGPPPLSPHFLPHPDLSQTGQAGWPWWQQSPSLPSTSRVSHLPGHYKSNSYISVFQGNLLTKKRELYVPLCYGKKVPPGFTYNDPYMKYSSTARSNSLVIIHEGGMPTKTGVCFTLEISRMHLSKRNNKLKCRSILRNPAWRTVSPELNVLCRSTICTLLCLIFLVFAKLYQACHPGC